MHPKGVIYTNRTNISSSQYRTQEFDLKKRKRERMRRKKSRLKIMSRRSVRYDACSAVVPCPFREYIDGNEIIYSFSFLAVAFSFFVRPYIGHASNDFFYNLFAHFVVFAHLRYSRISFDTDYYYNLRTHLTKFERELDSASLA